MQYNAAIGIEGNKRADTLAKEAAHKKTAPAYDLCPVAHVKRIVRENSLNAWQDRGLTASGIRSGEKKNTMQHQLFEKLNSIFLYKRGMGRTNTRLSLKVSHCLIDDLRGRVNTDSSDVDASSPAISPTHSVRKTHTPSPNPDRTPRHEIKITVSEPDLENEKEITGGSEKETDESPEEPPPRPVYSDSESSDEEDERDLGGRTYTDKGVEVIILQVYYKTTGTKRFGDSILGRGIRTSSYNPGSFNRGVKKQRAARQCHHDHHQAIIVSTVDHPVSGHCCGLMCLVC
ncbi:hypothetical protein evm_014699 [Chilo suppressalis]|nr:hypothetical protein evm_014699 [Chilo suppressalis]